MNRIIIIGNAFDLAHGIESSFKHFISDYFCIAVNEFREYGEYSDVLLEIKYNPDGEFPPRYKEVTPDNVIAVIKHYINQEKINIKFNSKLLSNAHEKLYELNWVDLENEYFEVLIAAKNGGSENHKEAIKKVNTQFEYLKMKLLEYLKDQVKKYSDVFISSLLRCFLEKIFKDDLVTHALSEDETPKNLFFLNFNYTKTIEKYFERCKGKIPSQLNYIHGNLSETEGIPIFGFGDEMDKRYSEFEDENNKELFKHIKSFEYLRTKNYYSLTRFIEAEEFQVHIYGHSCGISDRTLLNQIFEHNHCRSIKIFFHKVDETNDDFTDKTYEISRHFKDKGMMRKKVVPWDLSRSMPQQKKGN